MVRTANLIQIRCSINGEPQILEFDPSLRLLDVLREQLRLTGTKEGCGKGECGACTVLLDGRTVDSCLVMGYQADGSDIWTVEGLPHLWARQTMSPLEEVSLHPVQRAFVECGSSQCGICIPGMVVASTDLLMRNPNPSLEAVQQGLAGNLCRCTGYIKIFDAVKKAAHEMSRSTQGRPLKMPSTSLPPSRQNMRLKGSGTGLATRLREALTILSKNARDGKRQLAGGTDALVRAKDGIGAPEAMFDIFKIKELHGIREVPSRTRGVGEIWIGAATTFTEILESGLLKKFAPALIEACAVIGGPQIRNRGTIGGNFANASPAADSVPALMSLGAIVEIASLRKKRAVSADRFFLGPGKTVLRPDELITGVRFPKRVKATGCYLRLGQRRAQAISKVDIALTAVLKSGVRKNGGETDSPFSYLGICYGSVAPKIFRAVRTEEILTRSPFNPDTLRLAQESIKQEVDPIDDIRSSAEYRREMSAVLLKRALETIGLLTNPQN